MEEEKTQFTVLKNVFYNSDMRFCRSFFSLAVGAIDEKLDILEGFSASGVRGIRYAKENKNVKRVIFLDINKAAIASTKANIRKNKINGGVINSEYNRFLINKKHEFNCIEIDPFGSPVPYLYSTMFALQNQKVSYLCATATDTAVLCGPETKACLKNYHSRPMNNEFTHENGLRILIKRIAEQAAEFNLGVEPLVSLVKFHYIKVLFKVIRGAAYADDAIGKFGYTNHDPRTGERYSSKRPELIDYAGPLWLGEVNNKKFLDKMLKLNSKRSYEHREEIEKIMKLLKGEIGFPAYYYNTSKLTKVLKARDVPKLDDLIEKLRKSRFKATRTSFDPMAIKTSANVDELGRILLKY